MPCTEDSSFARSPFALPCESGGVEQAPGHLRGSAFLRARTKHIWILLIPKPCPSAASCAALNVTGLWEHWPSSLAHGFKEHAAGTTRSRVQIQYTSRALNPFSKCLIYCQKTTNLFPSPIDTHIGILFPSVCDLLTERDPVEANSSLKL